MKLITALGNSTNLILQIIDFFNGDYNYKNEFIDIKKVFLKSHISEIYLVLTTKIKNAFETCKDDIARYYNDIKLYPVNLPFEDIRSLKDDRVLESIIYNKIQEIAGKNLIISSGGLKNITQRLTEAGILYGCLGYFSMTADDESLTKKSIEEIRKRTLELNIQWNPLSKLISKRRNSIYEKNEDLTDNFISLF